MAVAATLANTSVRDCALGVYQREPCVRLSYLSSGASFELSDFNGRTLLTLTEFALMGAADRASRQVRRSAEPPAHAESGGSMAPYPESGACLAQRRGVDRQ